MARAPAAARRRMTWAWSERGKGQRRCRSWNVVSSTSTMTMSGLGLRSPRTSKRASTLECSTRFRTPVAYTAIPAPTATSATTSSAIRRERGPRISAPARTRDVPLARAEPDVLAAHEVPRDHGALLDPDQRGAVAVVLDQPDRAAHRPRAAPAAGLVAALAVAPELALLLARGDAGAGAAGAAAAERPAQRRAQHRVGRGGLRDLEAALVVVDGLGGAGVGAHAGGDADAAGGGVDLRAGGDDLARGQGLERAAGGAHEHVALDRLGHDRLAGDR